MRSLRTNSTKSKSLAAAAYEHETAPIEFEDESTQEGGQFQDFLSLTYGPPKIGKSTLWSLFEGVYFLPTEVGYKSLNIRKTYIPNWKTFTAFIKKMEKSKKKVATVTIWCVDTVDNLSKFCLQYVCGREDIAHPSDQEWGKGWEAFRDEFTHWILRLCALGPGVSFISHQQQRDIVFHGIKMPKETPAMPKTSYTVINNLVDVILKLSYVGKMKSSKDILSTKRCIYTRPTAMYDAGDKTKKLPVKIPFNTEEEAVEIIINSYKSKSKKLKKRPVKKIKKKLPKKHLH